MAALLAELRAKNVHLRLDGEQLRLQAPRGVLTPALQQELREHKDALVHFLRSARSSHAALSPLGPRARHGRVPLSFAQEGAWFIDQLQPGTAFNILVPFRMAVAFREHDLRAVIADLTDRHESLRTHFGDSDGVPYQIVEDHVRVPFETVDLRDISPEVRNERLRGIVSQQSRIPFDLDQGPLIRVTVVLLAERDFVVLPVVHHIVFDGWSAGVLQRDIAHLYRARTNGDAPALPPLPVQYPDYALWEREVLSHEVFGQQLGYWRRRLSDPPPDLNLAHDLQPGREELFRGDVVSVPLPAPAVEQLRALARAEGVTLFMLLLGAFRAVLMRSTGQDDVIIGTTVAQRSQAAMADVIGFCVNVVPLRTTMAGNPTFRELLAWERRTCLEAYENQDLPFGQLVRALRPDRKVGDSPLFRAQFALWDQPPPGSGFEGVPTAPLFDSAGGVDELNKAIANLVPAFDELSLYGFENASRFSLAMHYRKDLFDSASMLGMLTQLRTFLEAVAIDPDATLWDVPLLDPAARRRTSSEWPGKTMPAPAETVVDLFERRVAAAPAAAAVTEPGAGPHTEGRSLTYAQLNEQANRLAHHLLRQGLRPEQRVAVCLEKGVEAIVSVLGVMKAGLAFVAFDPTQGPVRLRRMIESAGAEIAVARRDRVPEPVLEGLAVVDPDRILPGDEPDGDPKHRLDPAQLAYVVFTSGSTGEPKGVMVTHGALAGAFGAWETAYGLASVRTHLQMANIAFDVFVGDLVRALCSGGHLVLCPRDTLLDSRELHSLLRRYRVECAEFVPAIVRSLLDDDLGLDFMKLVLVGSDHWSAGEYSALKQLAGDSTRVVNSYGVAEATIDSCWFEAAGDVETNRALPVGRPFDGSLLYVLDARLGLVGPGVPGELYLGGAGVARGYVGDPATTAARFLPNPFSGRPGDRLYRTGDRARWRADGQLEFLGRVDDQVKVRGVRIEPGDIEQALATHPSVAGCAVVARAAGAGEELRLVAHVVLDDAACPPGPDLDAALRRHLRERLPEYMVPATIVVLDRLPLTPNGKVDRRALPAPDWPGLRGPNAVAGAGADHLALTSPTELVLGEIFREVLGIEAAGAGSDFFALGGHSLKASQIVHRVRDRLRVELPLRSVFETPVLRDLAAAIDGTRRSTTSLPPIRPVGREGPAPLSYAQEGAWFTDQMQPGALFNIALPFHLRGALDVDALRGALADLVARHEVLRTVFTSADGVPGQVVLPPSAPAFEVVDRRGLHGKERDEALLRELADRSSESFDLERGPLCRTHLVRLSDDEQVLLIVAHHIVFDGYSAGVLGRDLAALYQSHRTGAPPHLPDLPVQYADYAVWQREVLAGEYLERHLDFWRRTLDGCPPGLDLPSDAPSHDRSPGPDTALLELSRDFSDSLRRRCEHEGVSLFMLLGAAFKALLSRYTGQDDVVVGTPVATRGQAEMADVIGFCVNVLALRTDLSGDPTFRELLRRERDVCLDAYAHQELPFGLMVQKLHPDRYLDRSPFFSVGFGLLRTLSPDRLPELESDALLGVDRQTWVEQLALHAEGTPAQDQMFLQIVDTGAELSAVLEHHSSMFAPEMIERMLRHYELLLRAMAEHPESRLSDVDLVDDEDHRALGQTTSRLEVPVAGGLHRLLEARARSTPDAVAVVVPGADGEAETHLTYDALNRKANQLARHLRKLGTGPECRVAICLERSADLLVALWAVLKAGGAYVPVDVTQRRGRLDWLLEDSGTSVLVTSGAHVVAADIPVAHVVRLDEHALAIAAMTDTNPDIECSEQQAAYLIYTSGSTGRPKAVVVEHRALVNGYHAWRETYGLSGLTCHLQLANFAFDVFTQDVIRALASGAALVLCPKESVVAPAELCDLVDRYGVAFVEFVPAVARTFMAYLDETGRQLPSLRRVVVGADVCYESELARLRRRLGPEVRVFNSYGVTEGSIDDTWFECSDLDLAPDSPAPIGSPFANLTAHVLDAYLQLVPLGGAGELYLGGAAVSRGYFGRPGLTAERYVPDPFGSPGSRLYRTGDRVRRRSDGNLAFLGRADGQTKLRGFRIEPGEIEVRLTEHPGITRALVVAAGSSPRERRLIAYVEGSVDALSDAALREFLLDRLPGYMVPSSFVIMDSLPTTSSGKVDLKALPDAAHGRAAFEAAYVAPRTPDEIELSRIWAEVLEVEQVGIHDNFVTLGGHSLLAARVVARVGAQLEVDLPLRALFQSPTVAGMARAVDRIRTSGTEGEEPVDLEAEACLAREIRPQGRPAVPLGEARHILLTGATGFLGAYLLRELLHQTTAEIHCLVRAQNATQATARIRRSLDAYGLWDDAHLARLRPLAGAIDQVRLGLDEATYDAAALRIDAVVHNAAAVGAGHSYGMLRAANVVGTEHVLRFACDAKDKPVHHVSTLSVFPGGRWVGGAIEEDMRVDPSGLAGGYPMSKWVAEQLVLEAGVRGLPVTIYRPGRIVNDSGLGPLAPTDQAGLTNLTWLLELGLVPSADETPALDVVPVDYVAAAVVHIARSPASAGGVFHLNNPSLASFADVVAAFRTAGFRLEEVSAKAWAVEVYQRLTTAPPPPVKDASPYIPAALRDVLEQWAAELELGDETLDLPAPGPGRSRVDCRQTLRVLEGSGIVCPSTADLLGGLVAYLLSSGMVQPSTP